MSPLTDEDKKKIEQEERYRAEIRAHISKPKSSIKGVLKLLFVVLGGFILIFMVLVTSQSGSENKNLNKTIPSNTTIQPSQTFSAEELSNMATSYCKTRIDDARLYPIPIKSNTNDSKTYELKADSKKAGSSLTQSDCLLVVNYLAWFKNYSTPKLDIDIPNVINRKYWIGMNVAELMTSVGLPDDINTTNYGAGETGQWIYYKDSYRSRSLMIYVEQSKVTSYQDF